MTILGRSIHFKAFLHPYFYWTLSWIKNKGYSSHKISFPALDTTIIMTRMRVIMVVVAITAAVFMLMRSMSPQIVTRRMMSIMRRVTRMTIQRMTIMRKNITRTKRARTIMFGGSRLERILELTNICMSLLCNHVPMYTNNSHFQLSTFLVLHADG